MVAPKRMLNGFQNESAEDALPWSEIESRKPRASRRQQEIQTWWLAPSIR